MVRFKVKPKRGKFIIHDQSMARKGAKSKKERGRRK